MLTASGLAVGDLNQDGRADVVSTGYRPGYVSSDGVTVPPGSPRIFVMLSHSYDGVFLSRRRFSRAVSPGR